MPDGISFTKNEDGSYTLDWDENHPVWSVFNTMSKEQIQQFVVKALEDYTKNKS